MNRRPDSESAERLREKAEVAAVGPRVRGRLGPCGRVCRAGMTLVTLMVVISIIRRRVQAGDSDSQAVRGREGRPLALGAPQESGGPMWHFLGRTLCFSVWRFGLTVKVGGIRLQTDEGRGVRYPFPQGELCAERGGGLGLSERRLWRGPGVSALERLCVKRGEDHGRPA